MPSATYAATNPTSTTQPHSLTLALGIRRHGAVDELGRGCGNQGNAPTDEIARFDILDLGHAPSVPLAI